jgi:hypothetical protein
MKHFTCGGCGASGSAAIRLVAEGRDFSSHQLLRLGVPKIFVFKAFTQTGEQKKIKAPPSSTSILRLTHDWWRIWWLEKIFSLPGKVPSKFVVARPWWRRKRP